MSKQEYAQASRDALQKYLVELIRAVVSKLASRSQLRGMDRRKIRAADG
jgi:hypothetical protein